MGLKELAALVKRANAGDEDAMLAIIKKFAPYYNKLARGSNNCVEENDLVLHLIAIVKILTEEKLKSFIYAGQVFNYIKLGIRNKYIRLMMRHRIRRSIETPLSDEMLTQLSDTNGDEHFGDVHVASMLERLTELQKSVIYSKYIADKSDAEISTELGISRQAVNRIKNRAIKQLKSDPGMC